MEEYLNAWAPVKTQKGDRHFSVEVWGRCYDFDSSQLPTQITSLGKQLLYASIKLTPVFGEKEETWQNSKMQVPSGLFCMKNGAQSKITVSRTTRN